MAVLLLLILIAAGLVFVGWLLLTEKKRVPFCTENQIAQAIKTKEALVKTRKELEADSRLVEKDKDGYQLWETPKGRYWIQTGPKEVFYFFSILAEQAHMIYGDAKTGVRPGDIVLDCGAHVGAFTRESLDRGAQLVVAIELSPRSVECLRRNFAEEIAAGRVVVYPKGVWRAESEMPIDTSQSSVQDRVDLANSANETTVMVPLTRIDTLVEELKLPRVDFIKMDIEGAERDALMGATQTIAKFKPRFALAAYHLDDEPVVLPMLIRDVVPEYWVQSPQCITYFEGTVGLVQTLFLQVDSQ